MNPETVLAILLELRVLRFFPNDESVMNAIVRLCGSMCASEQQVRWLVDRMTSGIYSEWPGIAEMRGCFCGRFKPADGINGYSSVYPDGLPPDPTAPPRPEIAAPHRGALPPGHAATADPELEASIARCTYQTFGRFTKPPSLAHHATIGKIGRKSLAEAERELAEAPRHYLTEEQKALRLAALQADLKAGDHP